MIQSIESIDMQGNLLSNEIYAYTVQSPYSLNALSALPVTIKFFLNPWSCDDM